MRWTFAFAIALALVSWPALAQDNPEGQPPGGYDACDTNKDGQAQQSEWEKDGCDYWNPDQSHDSSTSGDSQGQTSTDRCDTNGDGKAQWSEFNDETCVHWTPGCEPGGSYGDCLGPMARCDRDRDGVFEKPEMIKGRGCENLFHRDCKPVGDIEGYFGQGGFDDEDCSRARHGAWSSCDVDYDGYVTRQEHASSAPIGHMEGNCNQLPVDEMARACEDHPVGSRDACAFDFCMEEYGEEGFCQNPMRCDRGDGLVTLTEMDRCIGDVDLCQGNTACETGDVRLQDFGNIRGSCETGYAGRWIAFACRNEVIQNYMVDGRTWLASIAFPTSSDAIGNEGDRLRIRFGEPQEALMYTQDHSSGALHLVCPTVCTMGGIDADVLAALEGEQNSFAVHVDGDLTIYDDDTVDLVGQLKVFSMQKQSLLVGLETTAGKLDAAVRDGRVIATVDGVRGTQGVVAQAAVLELEVDHVPEVAVVANEVTISFESERDGSGIIVARLDAGVFGRDTIDAQTLQSLNINYANVEDGQPVLETLRLTTDLDEVLEADSADPVAWIGDAGSGIEVVLYNPHFSVKELYLSAPLLQDVPERKRSAFPIPGPGLVVAVVVVGAVLGSLRFGPKERR